MVTDYASTGTPTGITPLFSQFFNGNFRNRGPSLFSTPAVGFPSDSMVMVALDAGLVQAKTAPRLSPAWASFRAARSCSRCRPSRRQSPRPTTPARPA